MTPVEKFMAVVRERVVVFDGPMGTSIHAAELNPDDFWGNDGCNELLVLSRPDVIKDIHAAFLNVGVDVIQTNTFGAGAVVLAEYDIADRAYEINLAAARLAREVSDSFDRPTWVYGSLGPGTKLPTLGQTTYAFLKDAYYTQACGLIEGGVDLFVVETCQDLLQAKAAINGVRQAMEEKGRRLPLLCTVTIEQTGTMLLGSEIGAALVAMEPLELDALGVNCATGPAEMGEHVRYLSHTSPLPILVQPNAGLPTLEGDAVVYHLSPEELAEAHTHFVAELGVQMVGGCCGTTPEHMRAVVDAVSQLQAAPRVPAFEPGCASLYTPQPFRQDASVFIVWERTNATGSRQFRDLLLAEDWDGIVGMARGGAREGAHALDVSVDYVGRDGAADVAEVVSRLADKATLPLVIDSTEVSVMEAALPLIGGRPLINSINLEDGGGRTARVAPLCKEFGAAAVVLLIDEEGQARDVEWKLRVAHRIHDLLVGEYGLRPQDLIFDALTFPIGSGQEDLRRDGLATLEAVRRIKEELPGTFTILGVSNVSFGLNPAARQALNSVFLHEAIEHGLDAAIVNASKILPMHRIPDDEREACLDLIYDRRRDGYDPLQRLLELYADRTASSAEQEDRSDWTVERRLAGRIVDGDRKGLDADLEEGLASGYTPLQVINDILLGGMATVGELFASGDMQLPFVLQSAETMKAAVAWLEPKMEKADVSSKGTVVLATVKGDVHDIGKNLVDIILSNNGYHTVNLGIKQPISSIIDAAQEHKADAVGLSGLLVKSTLVMRDDLLELNDRGLHDEWPVILGGAALTRTYVEADLRRVFKGRLFYAKDAFEGLRTLDTLAGGDAEADWGRVPVTERSVTPRGARPLPESQPGARSDAADDNAVFTPPFLGSRVIKGVPLREVARFLNETALFRNQWQIRPGGRSSEEYEALLDAEARPRLRALIERCIEEQILVPLVVYGYFPAAGEGDDVVVYDPAEPAARRQIERFTFPRQPSGRRLCLADFVRPAGHHDLDYVGMQIVTVGARATEEAQRLFQSDRYRDYLELHGLSVEMAEALAEYWHGRVRTEWGFPDEGQVSLASIFRQGYRGGRYSFGYPACPNLEDHAQLFRLLRPERVGLELTEEWELVPEQSTSALVFHHPEAKYFVIR